MIITERLEELIKQQATIYDTKTTMVMLDRHSRVYQDCLILGHPINGKRTFHLRDLFETEEQAEWARKTIIEYTERFEPPMWEDIEDKYEFYFTCQDYKSKSSNPCGMFVVNKKGTLKNYILVRNVSHYPNIFTFDEPATKENYIKACGIVRDLFSRGNK